MESNSSSIAIDLGATSGRIVLGTFHCKNIQIQEIHRFPNHIVKVQGRQYWDLWALWREILEGLRKAAATAASLGVRIETIGVDTWGVDFVFLGSDGHILSQPRSYRDPYTSGIPSEFFRLIPREDLYRRTGIQIMDFNSVFQLYALGKEDNSALKAASGLLFIPDAVSYLLSGEKVCEYTILSTSALMNPSTHDFDDEVLAAAGVRRELFGRLVMPGEVIGEITPEVASQTGLPRGVRVVAVAGHDTGSAVAAVPAEDEDFAYLSSGTWSLMGVETPGPIVTGESFEMNFTNEGGAEGNIRFLKNITGMWLLERCREAWKKEGREYGYGEIASMLQGADGLGADGFGADGLEVNGSAAGEVSSQEQSASGLFRSLIDPDDPSFANPEDMPSAIRAYCAAHSQPVPESDEQMVRCIFSSLALKYRLVLSRLKMLSGKNIKRLNVIGGGSRNEALNQMIASSLGMEVVAGPSEATTVGNLMAQFVALGFAPTMGSMRAALSEDPSLRRFYPRDEALWNAAYGRYLCIIGEE